jgi:opacity protein-like surface antigen
MWWRISLLLVIGWFGDSSLFPSKGMAQEPWEYKGELFGNVGWGNFHHGHHSLGSGLSYTAGIGFRPFDGWLQGLGFQGDYNGMHFTGRPGTGYESKGNRQIISGNALYYFGHSGTQFFLLGGLGVLRAQYHYSIPGTTYYNEGTKMSLELGAGMKIRVSSKWAIRPEVRMIDTTIGKGYNWNSVTLTCGIGYHW